MGLKLFTESVEPPLCKGITFAVLYNSGKIPSCIDLLNMIERFDDIAVARQEHDHELTRIMFTKNHSYPNQNGSIISTNSQQQQVMKSAGHSGAIII